MRIAAQKRKQVRAEARPAGRVDATNGPILHSLLRLSVPALTANAAMVIHEVVNVVWLGMVGAGAIAAVAMAFPILAFVWATGEGITEGGAALMARFAGSRDSEGMSRVGGHVGALVVLYYAAVIAVGIPLLPVILSLVGTPAELVEGIHSFLLIMMVGMPLTELLYAYCFLLQAAGNTTTPVKLWSITTGANMILDPLLIVGLAGFSGWGLTGGAVAIVACRSLMALYAILGAVRNYHGIRVGVRHLRPDPSLLRRLLRLAAPIAGERMLLAAEQLILVSIVARFGAPVLAAYGVGHRIIMLSLMPGWAMATAVTAAVGQNLGVGRWQRAERGTWAALGLVFGLLSAVGLAVYVWPAQLALLFTRDEQIIRMAGELLRTVGPTLGFAGIFVVLGGAYQALERPVSQLGWTFSSSWVLKVPLAMVLSAYLGAGGIWIALALAHVAASLGSMAWIKLRCYGRVPGSEDVASYGH